MNADLLTAVLVDIARPASPDPLDAIRTSMTDAVATMADARVQLEQLGAENLVLREENLRLRALLGSSQAALKRRWQPE